MKRQSLKLVTAVGALAFILAGCMDSGNDMSGMDHSKMNMNESNNSESQEIVDNTTLTEETASLSGQTFALTAQTSQLKVTSDKTLPVWTFNNSVPGPEIRVNQGERVQIVLNNALPEPVTIHWHGVPVPNAMDGIPGVTQNAVQPGESFTYDFVADVPGTYWYHSHQDGVNQVDKGLYGSFIVEAENNQVDRDYTLVLDEWISTDMDMNMDNMEMGNMEGMDHGTENAAENTGDNTNGMDMEAHDMSMYDLYTINGKSADAIRKLTVKEGEKVRIRLINAGFMSHKMHLHGHEFKVTATDGQPINNPASISDQLIEVAPGERYDLEFTANRPGDWYLEEHGDTAPIKGMKAVISYENGSEGTDKPNESVALKSLDITKYGQATDKPFELNQTFNHEYTMNLGTDEKDGEQVFTINGKTYPDTEKLKVKKGDKVKVKLVNTSKTDDHPMHLHGHFFQVLSKNGKPIEGSPIMKDTLNVKPGEEYVIAFEADNPGDWMFHCHDLHHATAGMVTHVQYADYKSDFVLDPNAGNKPE